MAVRLYRVILPVSDIHKAVTFYQHLLALPGEQVSAGRHYFNCGGTILACFDPRADGDDLDARPNPEHIYFAVDDIESVHRRAGIGGCLDCDKEIRTMPWGERIFYLKDPFGNPIAFVDERTVFTGGKFVP